MNTQTPMTQIYSVDLCGRRNELRSSGVDLHEQQLGVLNVVFLTFSSYGIICYSTHVWAAGALNRVSNHGTRGINWTLSRMFPYACCLDNTT
jgi:hypothetical protein